MLKNFNKFLLGTCVIGLLTRRTLSTTNLIMNSESGSSSSYQSGTHSTAFVTFPDEIIAKKIVHAIVKEKLVACANIIPRVTSIYEWEGNINEDSEVLVMMKTRTNKIDELSKYIRENHPYSVAEVISLPIENGNLPYLDWISKSVPDKK